MLEAFCACQGISGGQEKVLQHLSPATASPLLQLWGAARPLNRYAGGASVLDNESHIGICGDWFCHPETETEAGAGIETGTGTGAGRRGGGSLETAFLSGVHLAHRILHADSGHVAADHASSSPSPSPSSPPSSSSLLVAGGLSEAAFFEQVGGACLGGFSEGAAGQGEGQDKDKDAGILYVAGTSPARGPALGRAETQPPGSGPVSRRRPKNNSRKRSKNNQSRG